LVVPDSRAPEPIWMPIGLGVPLASFSRPGDFTVT
jgi:hypothetical protein